MLDHEANGERLYKRMKKLVDNTSRLTIERDIVSMKTELERFKENNERIKEREEWKRVKEAYDNQ